ncbi:MAG TPA: hypothetical protein VF355_04730 [Anaerolineaceae bacterium]
MHRTQSARFWSHLILISALLGSLLPVRVSAQAAPAPAGSLNAYAFPTRSDLASLGAQLPPDPVAAVQALVEKIFGPDETEAQVAVGELMRRAGLPLVSIDGPVIGAPAGLVLIDASIYVELLPDLTRALRRGAFYTPADLSDFLLDVGFTDIRLDPQVLVTALGQWGKEPGTPLESLVAGAAIRALSGRRLQVLYSGVNVDAVQLDPLQVMLVLAHATSRAAPLAQSANQFNPFVEGLIGTMGFSSAALAQGPALAKGPCDDLANLTEPETQLGGVVKEKLKETLIETIKKGAINEAGHAAFDKGQATYEKGTAVLSTLLLLMGATINITDNKGGQTHFEEDGNGRSMHVILTATAWFDSNIARKNVACYQLAGIKVPPSGPLEGYTIRWNVSQAMAARGYQGKYLAPVPADAGKICASGSCGQPTGSDGTSTLEMYPATEHPAKVGALMYGYVHVTASLVKNDFPFALSDLLGLKNPAGFVAQKTWDLALSAIQKAGLPSADHTIKVGYHGSDIYIAQGETSLWLLYVTAPVQLDVYTCSGLTGNWTGTGGLGGDTKAFLGEKVDQVFGVSIPENVKLIRENFHFMINPEADESVFDINPDIKMTGTMRISQILIGANRAVALRGSAVRPVGEVEVEMNGVPVTLLSFGAGTVYPVYNVPQDPRCPGEAKFEYYP